MRYAYHEWVPPSTESSYTATPTPSTISYDDTYAEYYARCDGGNPDWLWTSTRAPNSESDLDDYLRLSTCYSQYDCIDDGEGYYYEPEGSDSPRLACGWAVGREWPDAEYGPL